jgi:biotin carboxyl carrier protein
MKLEVRIDGFRGAGAPRGFTRTVSIERGAQGEVHAVIAARGVDSSRTDAKIVAEPAALLNVQTDAIDLGGGAYSILLGGMAFEIQVVPGAHGLSVLCRGHEFHASVRDPRAWRRGDGEGPEAQGRQQVVAPMPGKVVRVLVAAGEAVEARQGLVVVEAMKMQNEIRAPKSGLVDRVFVREGQAVTSGEPLVSIA